jgi:hypothetical protein
MSRLDIKMKKLALAILLSTLSSPVWATTYFLATAAGGGSDSNNGTSPSTPWLTPNHAVNCGDVILAAASTAYDWNNFAHNWGTVTCAGGNNVAWLTCMTFDACKISVSTASSSDDGMLIQASYWGVQGWEITTTASSGACFAIYPWNLTAVHHVIFADDICNGAGQSGFGIDPRAPYAEDYIVFIGNIAYNTVQGGGVCASGFNMGSQNPLDTLPGTHIYVAGNFAWNNVEPSICNGGAPTDGQGFMIDTLIGNTAQIVYDNNISVFNGGRGVEVYNSANAPIYFRHNTTYGNNTDRNQANHGVCGEIEITTASKTESFLNLAQQVAPVGCAGQTNYAFLVTFGDATDHGHQNWGYSAAGNNSGIANNGGGFAFGQNNTFGANPSFSNPVDPPAPSCASASSVPNCMAAVIANFTPTVAAAKAYGYQIPLTKNIYDPLFPQWLCNVNLPAGLITMGCLAQSSLPASPTITGVKVH